MSVAESFASLGFAGLGRTRARPNITPFLTTKPKPLGSRLEFAHAPVADTSNTNVQHGQGDWDIDATGFSTYVGAFASDMALSGCAAVSQQCVSCSGVRNWGKTLSACLR